MFRDGSSSASEIPEALSLTSYGHAVRAAHALADLMKRTRPQLCEQVEELQTRITHCQQTLDAMRLQQQRFVAGLDRNPSDLNSVPSLHPDTLAALKELEATTQALLDLRHKGQMAR